MYKLLVIHFMIKLYALKNIFNIYIYIYIYIIYIYIYIYLLKTSYLIISVTRSFTSFDDHQTNELTLTTTTTSRTYTLQCYPTSDT